MSYFNAFSKPFDHFVESAGGHRRNQWSGGRRRLLCHVVLRPQVYCGKREDDDRFFPTRARRRARQCTDASALIGWMNAISFYRVAFFPAAMLKQSDWPVAWRAGIFWPKLRPMRGTWRRTARLAP
jgi:hypothetical protein